MILECVGLPGSGKSSFLRQFVLSCEFPLERVVLSRKTERVKWFFLGVIRHPCVAGAFFFACLKQPASLRRYVLTLCATSLAEEQKAAYLSWRYPKKIYVLDEGLLQRVFSCASPASFLSLYQQVRSIQPDHAYLFFKGGRFDRFEKDEDAKKSPRILAGKQSYEAWKASLVELFEWFETCAEQDTRVITLDNTHRPDLRGFIAPVVDRLKTLDAFSS